MNYASNLLIFNIHHRHLVAYWLEECMGIAVDEVKVYNQKLVKLNRPEYLRCMLLDEIK